MQINDYQDFQDINCGCCLPPYFTQPPFVKDSRRNTGAGYFTGFHDSSLNTPGNEEVYMETLFRYFKREWQDQTSGDPPVTYTGYWEDFTKSSLIQVEVNNQVVVPIIETTSNNGGTGFGNPVEYTYADPGTWDEAIPEIRSAIQSNSSWETAELLSGYNYDSQPQSTEVWRKDINLWVYPYGDFQGTYQQYRFRIKPDMEHLKYFKVSWDEVRTTEEWSAWNSAHNSWEYWKKEHDDWLECMADPSSTWCGDEPYDPGDEPVEPEGGLTLIASRVWEYTGDNKETPWYDIPLFQWEHTPGEEIIEETFQTVNVQILPYRSAQFGSVPSTYGTVIELD